MQGTRCSPNWCHPLPRDVCSSPSPSPIFIFLSPHAPPAPPFPLLSSHYLGILLAISLSLLCWIGSSWEQDLCFWVVLSTLIDWHRASPVDSLTHTRKWPVIQHLTPSGGYPSMGIAWLTPPSTILKQGRAGPRAPKYHWKCAVTTVCSPRG